MSVQGAAQNKINGALCSLRHIMTPAVNTGFCQTTFCSQLNEITGMCNTFDEDVSREGIPHHVQFPHTYLVPFFIIRSRQFLVSQKGSAADLGKGTLICLSSFITAPGDLSPSNCVVQRMWRVLWDHK